VDFTLLVFLLVYAGMILGGVPGLRIDRTGIALLGAIALVAGRVLDTNAAWQAIDVPTIGLLVGLMIVSAQFRLGGFYARLTWLLAERRIEPERLLLELVLVTGLLAALLTNDVVCLAVAPVLIEVCVRRGLDPVPFLLGLAAASNVGSAATLIGNPQNILIGQKLGLAFGPYLLDGMVPAVLGLLATWWILARAFRGRWQRQLPPLHLDEAPFDAWQTGKGVVLLAALVAGFLACPLPRQVQALCAAGLLLVSRRLPTRALLGQVDWQLCVLFIGLFIVNDALQRAGYVQQWLAEAARAGLDVRHPAGLFTLTVAGSNVISNVPLVVLLLPAATHPLAGPILCLASTLAGNLLLVGSIANLIVVEQASRLGVQPDGRSWFRQHLRTGVPITLVTLLIAAGWLWLRAAWR
jgi:Na+/H+ antiporter NhaD/arsenite permease-like protein